MRRMIDRTVLFSRIPYAPPAWVHDFIQAPYIPQERINLGRFPTPLQPFSVPGLEELNLDIWMKRDDLSSFDLSGNKVRKLEFLLADCLAKGHDSVITIGGIQSNHCKATAVAARQLGLEPHLILRTRDAPEDVGLEGNLMFDRMVGSSIYTVTPSTYAQIGSFNLIEQLADQLREKGKNPYVIPVGGSNDRGVFGYIDFVQELLDQKMHFDHIVFGCGSGGTACGMALGAKLSGLAETTMLHAVGVCDHPGYFYDHIRETCIHIGVDLKRLGDPTEWLRIYPGQGIGYARSTTEELEFLSCVSRKTGVTLDPVYSGKALYHFATKIAKEQPDVFKEGQKVLFVHTGGTLGLYEKTAQLTPLLPGPTVTKMTVIPPPKNN